MMKNTTLFMICLLWVQFVFGQQKKADSLEKVLEQALPDTTKIQIYNEIAFSLYSINPEKTRFYAENALKKAQEISFKKGEGKAYLNIGIYYRQAGDFTQALEYIKKGQAVFEKINNKEGIGNSYVSLGLINGQKGNFSFAHQYHLKALKLYESLGDKERIAVCLANIGQTYAAQKEHNLALTYYFKSLPISRFVNDSWREMLCYHSIATSYAQKTMYDSALWYFDEALKMAQKLNVPDGRILITTGETYLAIRNYKKALWALSRSFTSLEKTNNRFYLAEANCVMGKIYLGTPHKDSALFFFEKGRQIAQNIGAKTILHKSYQGMAEYFEGKRGFDSAYFYQKKCDALKDSIYNEEVFTKSTFASFAYDLDKKDKEIALQHAEITNQTLQRNLFFIVGLILLLALLLAFFALKQRKKAYELLEEQKNTIWEQKHELQHTLDDLKTTQAQLVQAEKMAGIGTLTAGIAHEINNPINFVKNNIENIETNLHDILDIVAEYKRITPENAAEKLLEIKKLEDKRDFEMAVSEMEDLVQGVKDGANRTAEIVKSLRTFTRLDDQDRQPAQLHENLDVTLLLLQNQYKDRIEIVKKYGSDIPKIDCFIGKINQVFMNLLSNAIQAIESKGTITISTEFLNPVGFENPQGLVQIRIQDTGGGIPEAIRHKVFEPFFTTKDVGKGKGLGLSISLGIVQRHGGNLTFESEMGKGTEFVLTLPVE